VPALLSAEMTTRTGRDPGILYRGLTRDFGEIAADRIEHRDGRAERKLASLSPQQVGSPKWRRAD